MKKPKKATKKIKKKKRKAGFKTIQELRDYGKEMEKYEGV